MTSKDKKLVEEIMQDITDDASLGIIRNALEYYFEQKAERQLRKLTRVMDAIGADINWENYQDHDDEDGEAGRVWNVKEVLFCQIEYAKTLIEDEEVIGSLTELQKVIEALPLTPQDKKG